VAGKEMEKGCGRKKEEVAAEREYEKEEGRTGAYQRNVMVVMARTPLLPAGGSYSGNGQSRFSK
jgi:hypothetical protein